MIFSKLQNIIETNNIPKDVKLMSDSGWECDATEMSAAYYYQKGNVVVFTQRLNVGYTPYDDDPDWTLLYREV